jgi:osmotically-inducible protein OsmY
MKTAPALLGLFMAAMCTQTVMAEGDNSAVPPSGKDSAIFVAVKSLLKTQHVNGYSRLDVKANANGEVWLNGKLDTQADADRAVELAKQAENVKIVHANLVVKTPN